MKHTQCSSFFNFDLLVHITGVIVGLFSIMTDISRKEQPDCTSGQTLPSHNVIKCLPDSCAEAVYSFENNDHARPNFDDFVVSPRPGSWDSIAHRASQALGEHTV